MRLALYDHHQIKKSAKKLSMTNQVPNFLVDYDTFFLIYLITYNFLVIHLLNRQIF